jgi:hypothetical protein
VGTEQGHQLVGVGDFRRRGQLSDVQSAWHGGGHFSEKSARYDHFA